MTTRREPGNQIQVEFRVGGDPFLVMPVTVVKDSERCIAHYLASGTRYLRRVLQDGAAVPRVVPIQELYRVGSRLMEDEWRGAHRLVVTRPGQAHAVFLRWSAAAWEFNGWYVNLQQPLKRTGSGFTTEDHFLDVVVTPDRTWQWKDEDELEEAVAVGRVSQGEADAIRREGERVVSDIEAERFPFDDSLTEWRPDPAWTIPALPLC